MPPAIGQSNLIYYSLLDDGRVRERTYVSVVVGSACCTQPTDERHQFAVIWKLLKNERRAQFVWWCAICANKALSEPELKKSRRKKTISLEMSARIPTYLLFIAVFFCSISRCAVLCGYFQLFLFLFCPKLFWILQPNYLVTPYATDSTATTIDKGETVPATRIWLPLHIHSFSSPISADRLTSERDSFLFSFSLNSKLFPQSHSHFGYGGISDEGAHAAVKSTPLVYFF